MQMLSRLQEWMTGRPRTRRAPARKPTARCRPHLEALEGRDVPSTLTVTNNLDSGVGSLRAEIAAASPGDTVNFASGLTGQTIKLTSGQLVINKSLTLDGPGASQLSVSGGNTSRVFEVYGATTNVLLSGLTITQGNGWGNLEGGVGGGIYNNSSNLTVSDCTLSNNRASFAGGGIGNELGTLNIVNSTLSANTAIDLNGGGKGGGVYSVISTKASITDCTLTNNTAGFEGGGIWIQSTTITISGSTLSGNKARVDGSAIRNASSAANMLTVINCFFSANRPTNPFVITGPWTNGGGNTFQ